MVKQFFEGFTLKNGVLGLQHLFVMFGQTTLVGFITGIPISMCLFQSGLGTLIFHFLTAFKIPVYLGSSFAFIAPIISVAQYHMVDGDPTVGLSYQLGGIFIAGIVYTIISFVIKKVGIERVSKVFTPLITGTMIVLIGLILQPIAVGMQSDIWWIAIVSIVATVIAKLYLKGFASMIPIIIGIGVGYLVSLISGNVLFEFSGQIFSLPQFQLPRFSLYALSVMIPQAIQPAIEHIGDIYAISMVTGKPFYKDPGMHKTMLGDGIATSVQGLIGGPANTTYSENTGVLAFTRVFDPIVMRIAQIGAIILSFIPFVESQIMSIPVQVMGGISILLFGMIASVGIRTLVQNKVEMTDKNVIIMSLMLVLGLGGAVLQWGSFSLQGLGLQAVLGIVLQLILKNKNV